MGRTQFRFAPGSRTTKLLKLLCAGRTLGGYEAVQILGTHNGDRDLRYVKERLDAHHIKYELVKRECPGGRTATKVRLPLMARIKARKLLPA
jgi:hypothetical protein